MAHTPVLLQQAIENLNIKKGGLYIDATFGEGGYSQEIIKRGGKVLAIEIDEDQIFNFQFSIFNLRIVQGNFAEIEKIAKENNFFPVDGVVFDLGLSMRQIEESGRGFSYKCFAEPLDMRIDTNLTVKASDLINSLTENQLYEIFAKNSEELNSRAVAKNIVYARHLKPIKTVADLIFSIDKAIDKKDKRVYQRIFQALRIEVNQELDNLKRGLAGSLKILKKGGRLVVISFHSLEDRIVKNFVREKKLNFFQKKLIRGERSFERSAKLRTII